jgi:hypothetical protein
MRKRLPNYKGEVWNAMALLASLHDTIQDFNRTEARQFRDALLRIYGSANCSIEGEGFFVPEIPPSYLMLDRRYFDSWGLNHVDLIEGGVAQLLNQMHPEAGRMVSCEEVEIEIGWKKRPEVKA